MFDLCSPLGLPRGSGFKINYWKAGNVAKIALTLMVMIKIFNGFYIMLKILMVSMKPGQFFNLTNLLSPCYRVNIFYLGQVFREKKIVPGPVSTVTASLSVTRNLFQILQVLLDSSGKASVTKSPHHDHHMIIITNNSDITCRSIFSSQRMNHFGEQSTC